jgi:hypothetical protein
MAQAFEFTGTPRMAHLLHLYRHRAKQQWVRVMSATCEVIGWMVDSDAARMMVRGENGTKSFESVIPEGQMGDLAIQTGTFRAKPILDPVTHECVGYEVECLSKELGLV